jgi:hypothetical protein
MSINLFPWFFQYIFNTTGIIIAFQCPSIGIFSDFEQSHPSSTLLRHTIVFVLTVHIKLSKVACLILEHLAIHR